MTLPIIIIGCVLLLLAFVFELIAKRINAPSVILMLLLGWSASQLVTAFNIPIPSLDPVLPVFGTVGLILIVLEGSMELELTKEKSGLIKKSFLIALIPILILGFLIAFAFYQSGQGSFKDCLSNAIPLCVISSAIAIPSVGSLSPAKKEFVIFESSLSDILGVLFFNFVALNHEINFESVEHFLLQILLILVVSLISTVGISFLLTHIRYHIKYIPILLIIVLVYAVSKLVHLPGLVFVLICGVFLGNARQFKFNKWVQKLRPDEIAANLDQFKKITVEFTFVIRVMFFILFGFLIKTEEVINPDTILWALGIALIIYFIRGLALFIGKLPLFPLLFVAPRGLITILLFFLILPDSRIELVNKSLITQVILITAIVMIFGLMFTKKEIDKSETVGEKV
jgi:Kef-type K+ transport system membrane component KefB